MATVGTSHTANSQLIILAGQSSADAISLDDRHIVSEATPTPLPMDTKNVDEEGSTHQTEEVDVSRAPKWTKKRFKFNIGADHHYLNVCVYDRLSSEEKGQLLIGHVRCS